VRRLIVLVVLILGFLSAPVAAQTDYAGELEAWREAREAALNSDTGWLTMAALHFLSEGDNTFGSSPLNDLVLSAGPPSAGVFTLSNRAVLVRATEGQTLNIDDAEVTEASVYPAELRANIAIGDLTMWVHYSGERLAIRVSDPDSPIRQGFTGLRWFPVDESFRVRAKFTPEEPVTLMFPNVLGDIEPFTTPGTVTLTLQGQEITMRPVTSGNRLWFIFRDLTSGTDTYEAARFLYADAPDEHGWTTVDFNQAYNPPCAFNPYTTCPLPPRENRLGLRVEAGEMDYEGPRGH
jgi:uncharacterized protein (DUF1684 family)